MCVCARVRACMGVGESVCVCKFSFFSFLSLFFGGGGGWWGCVFFCCCCCCSSSLV